MRLGVIGSSTIVDAVIKVVDNEINDIKLVPVYEDSLTKTPYRIRVLEKQVDAILFTGPNNYYYTIQQLKKPKVFWSFLPHNRFSALQALLQAAITLHSDLKHISLDTYSEKIILEALETVGITDAMVYKANVELNDKDIDEKMFHSHCQMYNQNQNIVCLTSYEFCYELLKNAHIPCVRILPAREIIKEQIYYLQVQHLAEVDQRGNYAALAIDYNYIFDDEKDFSLREWEKVRYQNEIKEYIYSLAQKLKGAVFSDELVPFFIITSKYMLENVFFQQQEHIKLLQFGQQLQRFRVCLGIGLGNDMLEAKSRSTMALNHAFRDVDSRAYISNNQDDSVTPAIAPDESPTPSSLEILAKQCGFTTNTLEKLKNALAITGNPTTAEELATCMQLNIRSVNRILNRLEDFGCMSVVSKKYNGKGRPSRIMKITI